MGGAGQTSSYVGGAGPGSPGKMSSDVITRTETQKRRRCGIKAICPEDCVQDIPHGLQV